MPVWRICKRLNAERGGEPVDTWGPKNPFSYSEWKELSLRGGKWGTPCLLPLGDIWAWQVKAEIYRLISKSIKGGLQSVTNKVA